jgi:hypothetical protein
LTKLATGERKEGDAYEKKEKPYGFAATPRAIEGRNYGIGRDRRVESTWKSNGDL